MRFEIIVPDDTRPELQARFARLTKNLSESPELVEEIPVSEDEAIEAMFTPERLEHIDRAIDEAKGGRYFTAEQVRGYFADKTGSEN